MKKYDGYEQAKAFTGEYETLKPGGYICKIAGVAVEEKSYGHLMRVALDIERGEYEGYYKRLFDRKKEFNSDAKWPGMYYQTIREDYLQYFKGFISAIENSNSGYKWDWDEKKLVNKLFGGIFGEEEYKGNDGSIKTIVKCRYVCTVSKAQEGIVPPTIKKLDNTNNGSTYSFTDGDDELPF